MRRFTVRHVTVYRYSEPVEFGEHRMMFRPRSSHDLRLVGTQLRITPTPFHNDELIEDLATALCDVWDALDLQYETIDRNPMLPRTATACPPSGGYSSSAFNAIFGERAI